MIIWPPVPAVGLCIAEWRVSHGSGDIGKKRRPLPKSKWIKHGPRYVFVTVSRMPPLAGLEEHFHFPFYPRQFAVGHRMSPLTRLRTTPMPNPRQIPTSSGL